MIKAAASAATSLPAATPTATPNGAAVFSSPGSHGGCPSGGGFRRHPSCHRTPDHHP